MSTNRILPEISSGPIVSLDLNGDGYVDRAVADGPNNRVAVFDATVMPPKQTHVFPVKDLPGWITFSIDGRHVYSASGEVFDARSKKLITLLKDEHGADFQTEKLLEIDIDGKKVVRAGSSFGVGQRLAQ